jgi:hypothetical protein
VNSRRPLSAESPFCSVVKLRKLSVDTCLPCEGERISSVLEGWGDGGGDGSLNSVWAV